MHAGNLEAYGFFLKNELILSKDLAFFINIGVRQSGSIGLSSIYYSKTIYWGLEERF
jgi:hypothetical protein